MEWDRVPDRHLFSYFDDLAYVSLQPDLFRHLFPACLKYWYDTLMRNEADNNFHYGLIQGQVSENMLTESERVALYNLFRDGMLDRIEAERGFVCSLSHKS